MKLDLPETVICPMCKKETPVDESEFTEIEKGLWESHTTCLKCNCILVFRKRLK